MEKKLFIMTILSFFVTCTGCSLIQKENIQENTSNPASEYCEKNGGTLEIVPDEGGSRGKCNFDDGSFCEERAYLHGECSPGRGEGNTIEIEEIQNNEEISDQEKEEVTEVIEEIGEMYDEQPENNEISCTTDVKICGDGTYVSRKGPDCEFESCPGMPLDENIVQETLKKYENTGSEMTENDINLMNEIIDIITQ